MIFMSLNLIQEATYFSNWIGRRVEMTSVRLRREYIGKSWVLIIFEVKIRRAKIFFGLMGVELSIW